MTNFDGVIYCDDCGKGIQVRSINIDKSFVKVNGKRLLLEYFVCPFCGTVYRVLLVDAEKYQELVDDFTSVKKRIERLKGKYDLEKYDKLVRLETRKRKRIKKYVEYMNSTYNGKFSLVSDGDNSREKQLVYRPCGVTEL